MLVILGSFLSLAALRVLFALSQREFWWEFPRLQAGIVLTLFWLAVASAVLAAVGGAVAAWSRQGGSKIVGFVGLAGGLWVVAHLGSAVTLAHYDGFSAVAFDSITKPNIRYHAANSTVEIRGLISRGSAAKFKEVLTASPTARVVEITSLGGLVSEAHWISVQIEARGMDTLVSDECASACVDIFASGKRRTMHTDALVGLHSAWSPANDSAVVETANREFFERLHKIGVEPRFLMVGTETPADDIWINTARQAYIAGLATEIVDPKK